MWREGAGREWEKRRWVWQEGVGRESCGIVVGTGVWCGVCIVVLYCFHMGSQGFGTGVIQTSINKMVHLVCVVVDNNVCESMHGHLCVQ